MHRERIVLAAIDTGDYGMSTTLNFEEFVGRGVRHSTGPAITLQASGIFALNEAAVEALGQPQSVVLLYDRDARVVGFRPADPSVKHAYQVRKDPRSPSSLVTGRAFCRAHAIPTDRGRRYQATMRGDVLTIDLKDEPVIPRKRQTLKPKDAR